MQTLVWASQLPEAQAEFWVQAEQMAVVPATTQLHCPPVRSHVCPPQSALVWQFAVQRPPTVSQRFDWHSALVEQVPQTAAKADPELAPPLVEAVDPLVPVEAAVPELLLAAVAPRVAVPELPAALAPCVPAELLLAVTAPLVEPALTDPCEPEAEVLAPFAEPEIDPSEDETAPPARGAGLPQPDTTIASTPNPAKTHRFMIAPA